MAAEVSATEFASPTLNVRGVLRGAPHLFPPLRRAARCRVAANGDTDRHGSSVPEEADAHRSAGESGQPTA